MEKPVRETSNNLQDNKEVLSDASHPANTSDDFESAKAGQMDKQIQAALASLCSFHKLPFSTSQAIFGLPTENGRLAVNLIERAAANLKLKAELRKDRPIAQSALVLPCIIFSKTGLIAVATEKNQASRTITLETFDAEGKPSTQSLPFKQVERDYHDFVVLVTPISPTTENTSDFVNPDQKDDAWFWPVVRQFWPNWSYVIFATFLINLLGLSLPLFVLNVYDKVIPNESIPTLWALIGGIGIALSFDFLLRLLRSTMIDNSGERVDLAVSANLFSRAMDVKMAERQLNAGQISNQVREFDSVRDFFSSAALTSLIDIVFIGIFLALFWFIVGQLALVPIIAVPMVIFVTLFIQYPLKKSVEKNQAAATNRHSVLVDSMVGIETVKAISAEGALQKRWERAVSKSAAAAVSMRFWSSFAVYFTMFTQQAVSVIVITWGVFLVLQGSITVGALIASNILVGRILSPLGGTASTLMRLQQSINAYRHISQLMRLDRENRRSHAVFTKVTSATVDIKKVDFTYPGQTTPALTNINFSIRPGEKIGVIGRVGSGKSTIGKLLCGMYSQDQGEVILDGVDTRKLAVADLRKAVGYVSQETELFSGSLRENILLAHPDRPEALEECARVSGVAAFAAAHPLGMELNVGERGRFLSGGQRQAVGLARMMVASPKLYFLDEPTSQMDTKTESQFIAAFSAWQTPEQTVMIATHRQSLLSLVDRVIIIEGGRIIADGPKDKVLDPKSVKTSKSPRKVISARSGKNG